MFKLENKSVYECVDYLWHGIHNIHHLTMKCAPCERHVAFVDGDA